MFLKKLCFLCVVLLGFISFNIQAKPMDVYVGIYVNDIINVDLKTNTYNADFYLWFRWQGDRDPSDTFEFVNSYEMWGHTASKLYETPKVINGWKHQTLRISGNFHHPFLLKDYPLDEQKIIIEIEDTINDQTKIRYIADANESQFRKDIVIPGWTIESGLAHTFSHRYPTSFGERTPANEDAYWRFQYEMEISRPKQLYLFKMLLPIIIVLLCTFIIFFINPLYADSRLAVAITALVSAVALQLTIASDLPSVGYLVLIDKIYNLSYLAIFFALAESVTTIYLKDNDRLQLAQKLDRITLLSLSVVYVTLCSIIIFCRG